MQELARITWYCNSVYSLGSLLFHIHLPLTWVSAPDIIQMELITQQPEFFLIALPQFTDTLFVHILPIVCHVFINFCFKSSSPVVQRQNKVNQENMKNLQIGVKIDTRTLTLTEEFKCSVEELYQTFTDPQVKQK